MHHSERAICSNSAAGRTRTGTTAIELLSEIRFLAMLLVANGAPMLAERLLGRRLNRPLDGHRRFGDGRPIFGASKTLRGIVAALLLCTLLAPLVSIGPATGALIAAFAMIGDLGSSFVKRRLNLAPGARVLFLDQVPESLLPTLVLMEAFGFGWQGVVLIVASFVLADMLTSPLLYRLRIRKRR